MSGTAEHRRAARTPVKQDGIIDALRCRILDRTLPPGSRMPTRTELQRRFKVSSVTIQRALDRLIADGFVRAHGRRGTFVADHPPHACNYGLVFPGIQGDHSWVRFWTALANEALAFGRGQPRTITQYHGIDGHQDNEDYQRLLRDVRNQRLAGLVFPTHPSHLQDTPAVALPGLPRVAVMSPAHRMPGVVPLVLGMEGFILRALDYFRARGRTRVALLAVPGHDGRFYDHFAAGLEQRGMGTRPYWIQLINQNAAVGARNAVHLLMNPDQVVRPDALLVSDDNLVEYASAGLIAAGIRVPEDCDVVAHCNFPWPTPSVMPVRRLGYDARRMLQLAIGEIDRQRAGGAASPRLDLAAQFEDEVQARLPVRR